ncbi:glycosyltransferase [Picrophilus oshimae]|uniref:Glycosyltransferase n=1 Tax=Picrophilus torridus (strain ATCC 700027 / DSM 9790 / JCM 10055 / NBRC 100828 / KAW 2/3) TaxID=1122961 RepID=Q6L2E9_PICTO|nr:glycosyltransferase [Picrophilus oshimae]AAT42853.1 glycosyltransferase [Picrophilus oshimae DSM 9789]SMD31614.1 Glycosyltransferase like family 2 [Picrophilus oshimae DSM 9789]
MEGISIVTTVKNEERHIKDFIESIAVQEGPFELIIVDSMSSDNTLKIINELMERYDFIRLIRMKSTRGAGRNIGARNSIYNYIAFIDGDAIADKNWLKSIRRHLSYDLIAGETVTRGRYRLDRVKIYYKGFEVTRPSANLIYKKDLFFRINGFDENFITAEDIDLNIRAIDAGARYTLCQDCIVYNLSRDDIKGFIKQAFWNGYGRLQLKRKHKNMKFGYKGEIKNIFRPYYFIRNFFGAIGYIYAIMKN